MAEHVTADTHKVSRVKTWLVLGSDKFALGGEAVTIFNTRDWIVGIIELVTHVWLGHCRPLGAASKVILDFQSSNGTSEVKEYLDQGTISLVLKET